MGRIAVVLVVSVAVLSEFTVGPDGETNFLSPVAQVPREEFELGQPTMRGIRSRAIHITCFLSPFSILKCYI